jgi:hypothetical protein
VERAGQGAPWRLQEYESALGGRRPAAQCVDIVGIVSFVGMVGIVSFVGMLGMVGMGSVGMLGISRHQNAWAVRSRTNPKTFQLSNITYVLIPRKIGGQPSLLL